MWTQASGTACQTMRLSVTVCLCQSGGSRPRLSPSVSPCSSSICLMLYFCSRECACVCVRPCLRMPVRVCIALRAFVCGVATHPGWNPRSEPHAAQAASRDKPHRKCTAGLEFFQPLRHPKPILQGLGVGIQLGRLRARRVVLRFWMTLAQAFRQPMVDRDMI